MEKTAYLSLIEKDEDVVHASVYVKRPSGTLRLVAVLSAENEHRELIFQALQRASPVAVT